MSNNRPTLAAIALACLLAGCQTTPTSKAKSETRALIEAELKAAAQQRSAAKVPDAVMSALVAPPAPDAARIAARKEPRFDLVFNNAPINQVFEAIAAGSRYSFVLPPGLSGTVAVNLKNVSAPEALDVLRELYGFDYRVAGSRIFVQPAALQTRIFQIAYPSGKRTGSSDTRVVSGSISNSSASTSGGATTTGTTTTVTEGSQVSTSTETDFWKELDAPLKAIVGTDAGRQIVLSQHSGVIVVRAMPKEIRDVEAFLRSSKLSIERQVMLEAKIVEVTLAEGYEAGINWASLNGQGDHRLSVGANAADIWVPGSIGRSYGLNDGAIKTIVDPSTTPATVTPSTLGDLITSPATSVANGLLGIAFSTDNFYGLLSFLETQGTVHVLSSPRVAAVNNQKAVLRVGTDDFFITNISTTTTTSGTSTVTTPTITVQPFFSGISLDVTPQIDAEGMVTMHVRPSVSTVSERSKVINLGTLGNFTLPLASSNVNETDTVVRVQDGRIVAIGGLMQQSESENDSRVPGAGDVPIAGNLFKRKERSLKKSELVFLIRPTIVKSDADWREEMARTEARIGDMQLPQHSLRERLLGE